MLLFPMVLNYLSPYLVIQGGFGGVLAGSGVVFAGLFVSSLVFGRAYCGWMCAPGGLQEVCSSIVSKPTSRRQNIVKYIVWVPWLAAIVLGFISAGGLKKVDMLFLTDNGISVTSIYGYVIYFFVVILIVVLSLTLGKRSFCHSLCWMAPFMVLGSLVSHKLRLPSLRLKANAQGCTGCGACSNSCPMCLPVQDMVKKDAMFHTECILCASCADTCPHKSIQVAFCRPAKRLRALPYSAPVAGLESQAFSGRVPKL